MSPRGFAAASGVVSDVIALAQSVAGGYTAPDRMPSGSAAPLELMPMDNVESRFYLRFSSVDQPGVLSAIAGALGKHRVSIASCHQRDHSDQGPVDIVMTTHKAREGDLRAAVLAIDAMNQAKAKSGA